MRSSQTAINSSLLRLVEGQRTGSSRRRRRKMMSALRLMESQKRVMYVTDEASAFYLRSGAVYEMGGRGGRGARGRWSVTGWRRFCSWTDDASEFPPVLTVMFNVAARQRNKVLLIASVTTAVHSHSFKLIKFPVLTPETPSANAHVSSQESVFTSMWRISKRAPSFCSRKWTDQNQGFWWNAIYFIIQVLFC